MQFRHCKAMNIQRNRSVGENDQIWFQFHRRNDNQKREPITFENVQRTSM